MPKKIANKGEASNGAEVSHRRSSRLQEKATTAPPPPAKKAPAKKAPAASKDTAKKPAAKGKKDEEKPEAEAEEEEHTEEETKKRKAEDEPEAAAEEKEEKEEKEAEAEAEAASEKKNGAPAKKAKKEDEAPVKVLEEGDSIPADLKVTDQDGKEHAILDLTKEHGIVIFMYPKASTPGCIKQACGFRDNYDALKAKGYEVYGMSADGAKAQTGFKTKQKLQYTLLSDENHKVIKALGAFKAPKNITRSHVVIEKGGVIKSKHIQVSPDESVKEAVALIVGGDEPAEEAEEK
ncbi:hypothetical protein HDU67_006681 [Dinochytrium kinnereticum]|nr:hypothetical protein HDU67_006681 [Dinochytrium kinnereticum]